MKRGLVACWVLAFVAGGTAQDVPLEYRVKAAFLLNFTRFVEWPASAFAPGEPLTICVASSNPFGDVLSATIAGETVAGRPLAARVIRDGISGCHVLFVPRDVAAAAYLRRLGDIPILTVGESQDFIGEGGVIRFVLDQSRVRFEINQDAAVRRHLRISSRLLQLARVRRAENVG